MALLHPDADITPTKLELLNDWLPSQSWYAGDGAPDLQRVGAFRFDDPDGEVGVETLLVRSKGGPVHQVPLTYRAAPLPGGDPWLICTMEHTVLGNRWVYDACGDPVYAATLTGTILGGGTQAQEFIEVDGQLRPRAALASVTGSGGADVDSDPIDSLTVETAAGVSVITTGQYVLNVVRLPGTADAPPGAETLSGTWAEQTDPVVLAYAEQA